MYVEILRKLFRLISLDFLLSADSNITDLATPKDTVYMLKIWDSRSEGGMEKWISKFRRTKAYLRTVRKIYYLGPIGAKINHPG